jgi:hypothetical protein
MPALSQPPHLSYILGTGIYRADIAFRGHVARIDFLRQAIGFRRTPYGAGCVATSD